MPPDPFCSSLQWPLPPLAWAPRAAPSVMPKTSHPAGTRSVSPTPCTSASGCCCAPGFSPQLPPLPALAAAEPHPYGALSPKGQGTELFSLFCEFGGSQNSRAIFSEHWLLLLCSQLHSWKKKYIASFYLNLEINLQVQLMTVFWKISQWPRNSGGSLRSSVEFQHYFMKQELNSVCISHFFPSCHNKWHMTYCSWLLRWAHPGSKTERCYFFSSAHSFFLLLLQ